MSKSKLNVVFVFGSVSYYANQSMTYFAKKGLNDTRMTRISRSAFETAQGALAFETECRAESAAKSVKAEEKIEIDLPTPATVDPTPAPVEAETVQAPSEVMDGTTRPDWAEMQTFERVTYEDLQAVPAIVARGLGFAAMGICKVAAMGIGALVGLGLMGLKRVMAR